jgi:hypothetical protein
MPRSTRSALVLPTTLSIALVFILAGPAPVASAACTSSHQNVEGQNTGNTSIFGNRGGVYVNAGIDYPGLNNSIHRSLFVWGGGLDSNGKFLNDVEVGWTAHQPSGVFPFSYTEWVNRGVDSGLRHELELAIDSTPNLRVQDGDGNNLWTFFQGSTDLGQSALMNFNDGRAITNSERRNTCDSGYAHFTSLKTCNTRNSCTWLTYGVLACYSDNMSGYLFDKIDNSQHFVRGQGIEC